MTRSTSGHGRRALTLFSLCLLALSAVGCAQNAFLELQVQLPEAPADGRRRFVEVHARNAAEFPFAVGWGEAPVPAFELTPGASQWDCVSVESRDDTIDLNVRVRFCLAEDCLDPGDDDPPERYFHLAHPFYLGRRTFFQTAVASIPPERCDVDADCDGYGRCDSASGVCFCDVDADCTGDPTLRCEAMDTFGGPGSNRCVSFVDRCAIAGCISGDSRMFCSETTGEHFCERGSDIDRSGSFQCTIPNE